MYEFACYLALGVAFTVAIVRGRPAWIALAFVLLSVLHGVDVWVSRLPTTVGNAASLGSYFAAGALLYMYRDRVPFTPWLALASTFALVLGATFGAATYLAPLPLAYLCLWLGIVLPLQRVGRTNDISYGMYIYAFPLAQILVVYGAASLGLPALIVLSVALTLPFAVASWLLVERPAMGLRRVSIREAPLTAQSSRPPDTAV